MNELTRKLVIQTARANHRSAERNADAFFSILRSAHDNHITHALRIPLKFRAQRLWQLFHPEDFDDGFLENWDIEEELSRRVNRLALKIVRKYRPQMKLDDYGALPQQVAHPALPQGVEAFYQTELDWCIAYMAAHPNTNVDQLMKRLADEFKPIPPIAAEKVASHAVNIRQQDQTIGLPLFQPHE